MIPKIIHWIWIGGRLPEQFARWMIGVREKHTGWDSIVWNEDRLRAVGIDVGHLESKFPFLAGISNAARLLIVRKFGGVYLDCDVECLRPMDVFCEHQAFASRQDHRFCNAVFGAIPEHPWVVWQTDNMEKCAGLAAFWGPELMTEAPLDGVTEIPRRLVYPFLWDQPKVPHEESILVHHWSKSWVQ